MSSFLISKIEKDISKENLNIILDITNEEIVNDISKVILSKKNKEAVLFLIENNKISKSMSLNLFQFIINNNYYNMFLDLDYTKFNIHAGNDLALRKSSEEGYFEVVKFLVENGANIHADNNHALRYSSVHGHIEIVKFLVENGANIHADNNYALKYSSPSGYIEIVKFLVENGANIHADNNYALRYSSYFGRTEVVKYLVEKGADVHSGNNISLICSSERGHIEIVKFLVEMGADIHANNENAIISSVKNGRIEVVKYLIKMGANIHIRDDYILRYSSDNKYYNIAKYLLNSDLEYFSKNKNAIDIVKKHKLVEFYEKFGIDFDGKKICQTKSDVLKYINSQDLSSLKKCEEFDFSSDNYYCFFVALESNNDEIIKVIFEFVKNKEELKRTYIDISS